MPEANSTNRKGSQNLVNTHTYAHTRTHYAFDDRDVFSDDRFTKMKSFMCSRINSAGIAHVYNFEFVHIDACFCFDK